MTSKEEKYLIVDFISTFERMHFLRGMENLLVVDNLGKYSGGLILNAEIGPDVPFKNIKVLLEGFEEVRN